MEQEKLRLYYVDMKYIRNLHKKDDNVSSVSPQIGKQHRVYIGVVVVCNKANVLCKLCTDEGSNYKGKSRCLDFKRLEEECDRFYRKNHH